MPIPNFSNPERRWHSLDAPFCSMIFPSTLLDHQSLDLVLQVPNLAHQIRSLVGGDACRDDCTTDATCSSESHLTRDVDVWYVLVFGEKRQVEKDGKRSSICGQDDDFRDTTVESLGGFVCALRSSVSVKCLLMRAVFDRGIPS